MAASRARASPRRPRASPTLTLRHNIHPGALRQIAEDRAAGRRLVLATASYRFYVEPIARRLGFDDVIATGSVAGLDDIIHARIDGENNYGAAKLRLVEAWLDTQKIARGDAHVRFLFRSRLRCAGAGMGGRALRGEPSAKLRHLAKRRGWRIVDWGL